MRVVRTVAGAAALGALAFGFASPASSDELNGGFYSVTRSGIPSPGTAPVMWYVDPCGSGCARIRGDDAVIWNAHLANGEWTASLHRPTAVDCRNGTSAPGTSVLTLDAQTLRGTIVSTSDGPACGSPTPITGGPEIIFMDQA